MFAQVALSRKGFCANVTGKRFDGAVQFDVSFAILLARESFVAHGALVRFLARMRTHVNVQISAQCKLLVASGARETSALSVNSNMALQIGQARE